LIFILLGLFLTQHGKICNTHLAAELILILAAKAREGREEGREEERE
jgi:hypothetical protein